MASTTITETIEAPEPPVIDHPPPPPAPPASIEIPTFNLPETDDNPMETPWHDFAIGLMVASVRWHLRDRTNYFVGGNMFVYYGARQSKTWEYRGPDFFFVDEVDGSLPRMYWLSYEEEGRMPDLVVELLSPSTAKGDRTTKKTIYEKVFRSPEYFLYDFVTGHWEGWRRNGSKYQPVAADARGWIWSEVLGLWLGSWEGTYLGITVKWPRLYDAQGQLFLTEGEADKARADALETELARLKRQAGNGKRKK